MNSMVKSNLQGKIRYLESELTKERAKNFTLTRLIEKLQGCDITITETKEERKIEY